MTKSGKSFPGICYIQKQKREEPLERLLPPEFGADLLSRPSGSTIGAGGLNFSVRDGKRWVPAAVGAFSLLAGGFPPAGAIAMNRARTKGGAGDLTGN